MNPAQLEQDLQTCVHCGLCLQACPTYLETGSEADSPRGRIVIMRALRDGRLSAKDKDATRHLDLCLGCRACEPACPSGVPYGHILEATRERLLAENSRPPATDFARRALLGTLTRPKTLSIALRFAKLAGQSVLPAPMGKLLAGPGNQTTLPVAVPVQSSAEMLPVITPAIGNKRFRVGMLTGCVMRVMYGDINHDTARVLSANGCEVLTNRRQNCCGALHAHQGDIREAKALARNLINAFAPMEGLDAIITNSAGCGSALKDMGHLLADDPDYATRAYGFAARVRDIHEWLSEIGWVAPLRPATNNTTTIAYHDACHLAHGQNVRESPRALLALIPGATLIPLAESDVCCGSAGIYNLTEPDMARRLQSRKLDTILATGANTIAAANPGCLAWIENGLAERGESALRVAHPVTLLAEGLA